MVLSLREYFIQTYYMNVPEVLNILDVKVVRNAKQNSIGYITVGNNLEIRRKNLELKFIWDNLISCRSRRYEELKSCYDKFLGNVDNKNVIEKKTEKKTEKKIIVDTRKIVYPIYTSNLEYKIRKKYLSTDNKIINTLYENKVLLKKILRSNDYDNFWNTIKEYKYGDVSNVPFGYAKHIFSVVSNIDINKTRLLLNSSIYLMYMILNISNVYNITGCTDYKDVALHILLKGKDVCINVLNNIDIAIDLINKKEYHKIYNIYNKIFKKQWTTCVYEKHNYYN